MRLFFASILILITVSACALGAEPAGEISLTVIPMDSEDFGSVPIIEHTETSEATYTPSWIHPATLTRTPTPTPFAPQPTETPGAIQSTENCTVLSNLPIYTVVAGDTLSNIATRYATTTAELAEFNCLTDANLISTGMQLHVPFIPPTLTPFLTATPYLEISSTPSDLGIRGTLGVYPAIESSNPSDWNDYVIEPQTPFTVNWTGIEPEYYNDIVTATFIYTGDDGTIIHIGVDENMADGISVTWTPFAGISGSITGSARTVDNGFWRSSTLHVREPEEATNEESGCQFILSETAEAYENPHSRTRIVATDIAAGLTFAIIDLTVVDIGTFVKVEVNAGVEGWISGNVGSVTCPGE